MNIETAFYITVVVLLIRLIFAVRSLHALNKETWIHAFSITIDDMHKTLIRIEEKLEDHSFDIKDALKKDESNTSSIAHDFGRVQASIEIAAHTLEQIQRNTHPQAGLKDWE